MFIPDYYSGLIWQSASFSSLPFYKSAEIGKFTFIIIPFWYNFPAANTLTQTGAYEFC